jgi:hypothetical protein
LRIWRYEKGQMKQRWMDEHIKLSDGKTIHLKMIWLMLIKTISPGGQKNITIILT